MRILSLWVLKMHILSLHTQYGHPAPPLNISNLLNYFPDWQFQEARAVTYAMSEVVTKKKYI